MKYTVVFLSLIVTFALVGCIDVSRELQDEEAVTSVSGSVNMDGSTSMEKVMKTLNGAFTARYPNVNVELNLTGSGAGIKEAAAGRTDIGNTSRYLKDGEGGVDFHVIGIDGIVVIVNKSNPIKSLTLAELQDIYAGKIRNWRDVGGFDRMIVLVGREDGSGTRDGFESIVMGETKPIYGQELESTGSVISSVEMTAGAIGYASFANVDKSVKSVVINGVMPTEDTIKNKAYPIQRPFACVVKKGCDDKLVKLYLDFVFSEKGQEQVRRGGAVPVK